ncbi:hypothetical protein MZM54_00755 [[Brevibacterium] frigoritolerans]|nr:hypothetical protein [Peribacillus frigoritolerans]
MDTNYFIHLRYSNLLRHKARGVIAEFKVNSYPHQLQQEFVSIDNVRYSIAKQEHVFQTEESLGKPTIFLYIFCKND